MKKLLTILFVVIFAGIMITGCGEIKSIDANTLVSISRAVDFDNDPILYIACNKAVINYEKRAVIIEGLVSIAGTSGGTTSWIVKKMEIQDRNLIIYIPDDVCYKVRIGPFSVNFYSKNWEGGKIREVE